MDKQRQQSAPLSSGHKRPSEREIGVPGSPFPTRRRCFGKVALRLDIRETRASTERRERAARIAAEEGREAGGLGVCGKRESPRKARRARNWALGSGNPRAGHVLLDEGPPTRTRAGPRLTCFAPAPTSSVSGPARRSRLSGNNRMRRRPHGCGRERLPERGRAAARAPDARGSLRGSCRAESPGVPLRARTDGSTRPPRDL
ncbi:hypothetical protein PAL_GLEAN10000804 [Pteropus alecto]|uniref:Uncharacterized protein n=1 Tax=Pteropus alecto TaxID=9402 RepID=L5K9D8_PTEAL|nr:hypothetical protein PAL_GLEAN10000804 [Pteropus alecto]